MYPGPTVSKRPPVSAQLSTDLCSLCISWSSCPWDLIILGEAPLMSTSPSWQLLFSINLDQGRGSSSARCCLCHALMSPMETEHHGHEAWRLDSGNPWWGSGHYHPAWACRWAFKSIRALCIDCTGCSVPARLSNYLSFVQFT